MEYRIGQGIDIHTFDASRPLYLGGVMIEGHPGLSGHSDADVLLHAITDAILGATGNGDIGIRFPNTDPNWKGASSVNLLEIVWQPLEEAGWKVVNLDCSIVAETPKVGPHAERMKAKIGQVLKIEKERIGIKATTPEGLGALGRSEGIMAFCSVLLTSNAKGIEK